MRVRHRGGLGHVGLWHVWCLDMPGICRVSVSPSPMQASLCSVEARRGTQQALPRAHQLC